MGGTKRDRRGQFCVPRRPTLPGKRQDPGRCAALPQEAFFQYYQYYQYKRRAGLPPRTL
jgi:hypothetical protein